MATIVRSLFDPVCRWINKSIPLLNDMFKDRVLRIEILDDMFESEQSTSYGTQPAEKQETFLLDSSKVERVITKNISSTQFVSKSTFFLKMLSNGMKESKELQFTLKISSYEEAPFMDLLDYIEAGTLPKSKNPVELLELLIMADKFDVSSCITSCVDNLLSLPMTCELALLFSSLPTTISKSSTYQSLIDSAHEFYAKTLTALDVFPDDTGDVDQAIIETVLSRNDLNMISEDTAYDFLMKWVTAHFSDLEGKRGFLHSHVRNLIRFPHMSDSKLSEFYGNLSVDKEFAMEIKLECDIYKEQQRKKECTIEKVELRSSNKLLYAKRLYFIHPVIIEQPKTRGEGYNVCWKLDKEECRNLEKLAVQYSDTFLVGSKECYLAVDCKSVKGKDKPRTLGTRLHIDQVQSLTVVDFKVEVEMADGGVMIEESEKGVLNWRKKSMGIDLVHIDWRELMAEDSKFFINGTMTLTAIIGILV